MVVGKSMTGNKGYYATGFYHLIIRHSAVIGLWPFDMLCSTDSTERVLSQFSTWRREAGLDNTRNRGWTVFMTDD